MIEYNKQPAPVHNDSNSLWEELLSFLQKNNDPLIMLGKQVKLREELIGLMRNRDSFGIEKYGTSLQLDNGRDFFQDAFEEALDLSVYAYGVYLEEEKQRSGSRLVMARLALNNATMALAILYILLSEKKENNESGKSND